jgi:cell division protein FtsZ
VIINLDFADVSAVMKDAGRAHMGVGTASGREKAEQAAQAAIASPLLETAINGATGVLVNVTGSSELTLDDVETAANIVQEAANPDANIIFGATSSDDFEDEMRVTVIATGFEQKTQSEAPKAAAAKAAAPAAAAEEKPADVGDIDAFLKLFNR